MNAATVGVSLAPKRKNVLTSKTKLKKLKLTAQVEAKRKLCLFHPCHFSPFLAWNCAWSWVVLRGLRATGVVWVVLGSAQNKASQRKHPMDRGSASLGNVSMRVDPLVARESVASRHTSKKTCILTTNAAVYEAMKSMTMFVLLCEFFTMSYTSDAPHGGANGKKNTRWRHVLFHPTGVSLDLPRRPLTCPELAPELAQLVRVLFETLSPPLWRRGP